MQSTRIGRRRAVGWDKYATVRPQKRRFNSSPPHLRYGRGFSTLWRRIVASCWLTRATLTGWQTGTLPSAAARRPATLALDHVSTAQKVQVRGKVATTPPALRRKQHDQAGGAFSPFPLEV